MPYKLSFFFFLLHLLNEVSLFTQMFFLFTQIPALAVEMPGSADISGLNLQFGALQFGSEPVLPEYDASAAVATTTPGNQGQNSLYTSASKWVSRITISND